MAWATLSLSPAGRHHHLTSLKLFKKCVCVVCVCVRAYSAVDHEYICLVLLSYKQSVVVESRAWQMPPWDSTLSLLYIVGYLVEVVWGTGSEPLYSRRRNYPFASEHARPGLGSAKRENPGWDG